MIATKPFSQACENNKLPIFECLSAYILNGTSEAQPSNQHKKKLFEVGSGTGQHACFFAQQFPNLDWQASDLPSNIPGIVSWFEDQDLSNLLDPIRFDVNEPFDRYQDFLNSVAESPYDYLFTANTLHIMSWQSVENLFCWLPKILKPGGLLFTYGPFKFEGCFTSESNKSFDVYLKKNNPEQGIRDIEALEKLACKMDIGLLNRHDLPANNHLLVWRFNPAA